MAEAVTSVFGGHSAGMVLLAGHRDPVVPDADDRLDDTDAQSTRVERVALLDMGFEIPDVMPGVDPLAGTIGKAGACQGFAQRQAGIAAPDLVYFCFGKRIGERAAAEKAAVMAFLVGPGGDLEAEPGAIR